MQEYLTVTIKADKFISAGKMAREYMANEIAAAVPPMFEFDPDGCFKTYPAQHCLDVYWEVPVRRAMSGNQYLLWRE
jgi:hypothetical protein